MVFGKPNPLFRGPRMGFPLWEVDPPSLDPFAPPFPSSRAIFPAASSPFGLQMKGAFEQKRGGFVEQVNMLERPSVPFPLPYPF